MLLLYKTDWVLFLVKAAVEDVKNIVLSAFLLYLLWRVRCSLHVYLHSHRNRIFEQETKLNLENFWQWDMRCILQLWTTVCIPSICDFGFSSSASLSSRFGSGIDFDKSKREKDEAKEWNCRQELNVNFKGEKRDAVSLQSLQREGNWNERRRIREKKTCLCTWIESGNLRAKKTDTL